MARPKDAAADIWAQKFAGLRQRLESRIRNKFYNMLPAWEQLSGGLDDLLSEVAMAFLKSARAGKFGHDAEDGALLAWLQTVAGNKLKDAYRKWQKRGANARLDARSDSQNPRAKTSTMRNDELIVGVIEMYKEQDQKVGT